MLTAANANDSDNNNDDDDDTQLESFPPKGATNSVRIKAVATQRTFSIWWIEKQSQQPGPDPINNSHCKIYAIYSSILIGYSKFSAKQNA